MNRLEVLLTLLLASAIVVERVSEVIKPIYLNLKELFYKQKFLECTPKEKVIISILVGCIVCIVGKIGLGISPDMLNINFQYVFTGLMTSLGSNIIHSLLSIVIALKNGAESIKK